MEHHHNKRHTNSARRIVNGDDQSRQHYIHVHVYKGSLRWFSGHNFRSNILFLQWNLHSAERDADVVYDFQFFGRQQLRCDVVNAVR